MARDFFKKAPIGTPAVSGVTIRNVQASLNAANATVIDEDGIFGQQTMDAVSAFQQARSLSVTGAVSDITWASLMHTPEPPIFERCLQVVASFEGTGFTLIEGNFDGAGLTWGIIGFTLRDGELGKVLSEISVREPALFAGAFGENAKFILDKTGPATSKADKIAFADSITGQHYRVAEPWRTAFATLGRQLPVQRIQVERARKVYWEAIALKDAEALDMKDELDLLLLYDVAVQNGGMTSKGRLDAAHEQIGPGMSAVDRRNTIAKIVADSAAVDFQHDVMARKTCIATGTGTVHGSAYTLDLWGFRDGFQPKLTDGDEA